jgi:hypothetical protein
VLSFTKARSLNVRSTRLESGLVMQQVSALDREDIAAPRVFGIAKISQQEVQFIEDLMRACHPRAVLLCSFTLPSMMSWTKIRTANANARPTRIRFCFESLTQFGWPCAEWRQSQAQNYSVAPAAPNGAA